MNAVAGALRWILAQRRRALGQRIAFGLLVVLAAFGLRLAWHGQRAGLGLDLMLPAVILATLLFGLAPGLVAAVSARLLAIWWFTEPVGMSVPRSWDDAVIATLLALAVAAAAVAGTALRLALQDGVEPDDPSGADGRWRP